MTYQFGLCLGSNFLQNEKERNWYLHLFYARRLWLFWTTEVPRFTSFMQKLGIRLVPKWVRSSDPGPGRLADSHRRQGREVAFQEPQQYLCFGFPCHVRTRTGAVDGKNGPLNGQPYPQRLDLASDMYDHNAAAHETSGDTLTYLFYEMSKRPASRSSFAKSSSRFRLRCCILPNRASLN